MSVRRVVAAVAALLLLALVALFAFVPLDDEPASPPALPRLAQPTATTAATARPAAPAVQPLAAVVPASGSPLTPPLVLGWNASKRMGIPAVDSVIEAVIGGDADAVRGLIRYSIMACTSERQVPGSPPACVDDEDAFQGVEVVRVSMCGFEHARAGYDGWVYERLTGGQPRLYALLRPSGLDRRFWPQAQYVAVFLSDLPQAWSSVVVQDGVIMSVRLGCGEDPAERLARFAREDVLLPPPQWEAARLTGIDAVDDAIYAVSVRDPDVLRLSLSLSQVGCVTAADSPSRRPLCEPGESFGDPVDAFPVAGCRDAYLRTGEELTLALESMVRGVPRLYGVFEGGSRPWPPGDYEVLLTVEGADGMMRGLSLVVADAGVVGLRIGCDASAAELLAMIEAARDGPPAVIVAPSGG